MEISRIIRITTAYILVATYVCAQTTSEKSINKEKTLALGTISEDTTRIESPKSADDTLKSTILDTIRKQRSAGLHKATWYRTERHKRVHRNHPTAAYNYAPLGTVLRVTNTANNRSCLVTVTDRMGNKSRKVIDLSHSAFGIIAEHSSGNIKVQVAILD